MTQENQMDEYQEAQKFASLCAALAMSEQCEDWTSSQIENEAHRIMDLNDSPKIP